MFRPVPMTKIHVLVLEKHLDAVTATLGRSRAVHLEEATRQSPAKLLHGVEPGADLRQFERLWQRAGNLLEQLGLPKDPVPYAPAFPPEELRKVVDTVEERLTAEEQAIQTLVDESGGLVQTSRRLEQFPFRTVAIRELRDLHHLYMTTGRLSPERLDEVAVKLRDRAVLLHEFDSEQKQERILILASRKNRWAVESELKNAEFAQEPLPDDISDSPEAEQQRVKRRLSEIQKEIGKHRDAIAALRQEFGRSLTETYCQLTEIVTMLRARRLFGRTEQVFCITGWVPRKRIEEIRGLVLRAANGAAVVETVSPEEDEQVRRGSEKVPVKFPDIRIMRPFQQLVTLYGTPRYDEIEPSLLLAVTFVLMFGMMFGDLGHGLVFFGIGLYLFLGKRAAAGKLREVGLFLLFCGGISSIFGILYDSFFGREEIIARWPVLGSFTLVHPLTDLMSLFKVSIALGILCITIGIAFNIRNRFRRGEYFEGVFDKFGVIGMVFYWGSLGLGLKAMVAGRIHGYEIFGLVILPLALLFAKDFLARIFRVGREEHSGEEGSGLGLMVFTAIIEVMETLTTFLSNTISFVRLAGFALSHAALCLAVYTIAAMIRGLPAGGALAVFVVIGGNIFVMILEGMIVTIQGLRLEYY